MGPASVYNIALLKSEARVDGDHIQHFELLVLPAGFTINTNNFKAKEFKIVLEQNHITHIIQDVGNSGYLCGEVADGYYEIADWLELVESTD